MDDNLNKEKIELEELLDKGVNFSVNYRGKESKFVIHEFTLDTLIRISELCVRLRMNETKLENGDMESINEARRCVMCNSRLLSKIIAHAILGERYYIYIFGRTINRVHALNKLSRILEHSVTPHKMMEITNYITAMCNLGDFIYSTRLMNIRIAEPRSRVE